ncbi:RnfABCDGE type electron transport complex subunit G [candidate division KSB1 bacterium]|nr:RnfABCDGE type electron transport complex subunit G [candidate division KSB1 bacterium]
MKDILKLSSILMLITTIAATALAAVYSVTKPRIELKKQEALNAAKSVALPGADLNAIYDVKGNDKVLYYSGYMDTTKSNLVGYAFLTSGRGYSSDIESIVGVDSTGNIIGIQVLSQTETPGLGTRIEEIRYGESLTWVQKQFIGKSAKNLAVDKDGGEIQSITGATISSRAVTNSIVAGYEDLLKQLKETN